MCAIRSFTGSSAIAMYVGFVTKGWTEPRILDPFHQPDESIVVGPHRSEPDAAIAHNDRRSAKHRRWRQATVPGRLAVVMCVNADPARARSSPVASMLSTTLILERSPTAAMRSPTIATSARLGLAPVPSISVAPQISRSMSSMENSPVAGSVTSALARARNSLRGGAALQSSFRASLIGGALRQPTAPSDGSA